MLYDCIFASPYLGDATNKKSSKYFDAFMPCLKTLPFHLLCINTMIS